MADEWKAQRDAACEMLRRLSEAQTQEDWLNDSRALMRVLLKDVSRYTDSYRGSINEAAAWYKEVEKPDQKRAVMVLYIERAIDALQAFLHGNLIIQWELSETVPDLDPLRVLSEALGAVNNRETPPLLFRKACGGRPPKSRREKCFQATAVAWVQALHETGMSRERAAQKVANVCRSLGTPLPTPARSDTPSWKALLNHRTTINAMRAGDDSQMWYEYALYHARSIPTDRWMRFWLRPTLLPTPFSLMHRFKAAGFYDLNDPARKG